MIMKRKFSDKTCEDEAVRHYLAGHTMQETLSYINDHIGFMSDRALRKLLRDKGISRGVSGAQKLKRFKCYCEICKNDFIGRTPTAVMCDECVGENAIGATKERLQKYARFKRMQSYGIDLQTYDLIFKHQLNQCGLCKCNLNEIASHLVHLDHCHKTGRVRGILCQSCNHALGVIEKRGSHDWLKRAKEWI